MRANQSDSRRRRNRARRRIKERIWVEFGLQEIYGRPPNLENYPSSSSSDSNGQNQDLNEQEEQKQEIAPHQNQEDRRQAQNENQNILAHANRGQAQHINQPHHGMPETKIKEAQEFNQRLQAA